MRHATTADNLDSGLYYHRGGVWDAYYPCAFVELDEEGIIVCFPGERPDLLPGTWRRWRPGGVEVLVTLDELRIYDSDELANQLDAMRLRGATGPLGGRVADLDLALSPGILTHAAEACDDPAVLAALLEHPSSLVREGAVYGLQRLGPPYPARLLAMVSSDPSPGVRAAARDAVEDDDGA